MKERVTTLEAQRPHIDASLTRIEKSVEKLNGHFVKVSWMLIALFIAAVAKVVMMGGVQSLP